MTSIITVLVIGVVVLFAMFGDEIIKAFNHWVDVKYRDKKNDQ